MNARRDSSDEPLHGSFGGRLLLTAAIFLAVAATGVLILSDDLKWMRLGIVAGLWAALVGAFIAARYRRQVADREDEAVERQERYELELEREIAARREYELEAQAEAKRRAEEEAGDHLAALRAELNNLRHTLQTLLGGEVLVERYALRAESTRMRSLPEGHAMAREKELKRLPPARARDVDVISTEVREAHTDLIERVHEVHHPKRTVEALPRRADRPARTEFPRPERAQQARMEHTPHPAELSDRWFVPDGLGEPAPRTNGTPKEIDSDWTPSWEAAGEAQPYTARQYVQQTQVVARQQGTQQDYGWMNDVRHAAAAGRTETSGYTDPQADAAASAQTAIRPVETSGYLDPRAAAGRAETSGYTDPRAEASGYTAEASGYTNPGAEASGNTGPRAEASGYPSSRAGASGYTDPRAGAGPAEASGYPTPRAEASGYPSSRAGASGYTDPRAAVPRRASHAAEASGYMTPVGRVAESGYVAPVRRNGSHAAEASGYVAPVGRRAAESGYMAPVRASRHAEPTGAESTHHRRAVEDEPVNGGGRRHRAEGQPNQPDTSALQRNGARTGSHARPEPEPEPSGSHASGRSVSELLASHGGGTSTATPRRRRRRAD